MRLRTCVLAALVLLTSATTSPAVDVLYDGFGDTTGLTLNGTAGTTVTGDGTVLRLTSATTDQGGSAFSSAVINAAEFSTYFKFRITEPGGISNDCGSGETGADGLTFVVQSVSSSIGGAGGGLGYQGIGTSAIVEWDTWCNEEFNDPNTNHLGININGIVDHGAGAPFTTNISPSFDDGNVWHAWVDYDGTTLEARTSQSSTRPAAATLSRVLDIPTILGNVDEAYVGFTSGTGSAFGNHDVISWEYRSEFDPIPEPSTFVLAGLGGLTLLVARRWRKGAAA